MRHYSSAAQPTTLNTAINNTTTTIIVNSIIGFPALYPYTLLLDWGNSSQEVVTVTQAPTGSGPYTFSNCIRGEDGTTAVSHTTSPACIIVHGVSARDFTNTNWLTDHNTPLMRWYAGLANRNYARCNVVCLGDSLTEGQGATDMDYRWVARLRDNLRNKFPTAGLTGGGRGFLPTNMTGEGSFLTVPWSTTGSPGNHNNTIGPKQNYTGFDSTQTISYSLVGDSADIMWWRTTLSAGFTWKVDSGGTTDINTNGTNQDGLITHVSLGSAGSHTLTIQGDNASFSAFIDGVVEYNGDYSKGIQVHDAGHFGADTNFWTTDTNAADWPSAINALNPNLILISLGVNDQGGNVAPATFQSRMQTLITTLRSASTTPYPSIALVMYPPRNGQGGYTYPWSQYVQAAYNVSASDTGGIGSASGVAVMDFTVGPRMFSSDYDSSNSLGLWHTSDLVHPSNKGHALIADAITQFLMPM